MVQLSDNKWSIIQLCLIPFLSFQGAGISASSVLHGMVFKKETEGDVTSVKDAKIAVYSCPFDGMITETKVCKSSKRVRYLFMLMCSYF